MGRPKKREQSKRQLPNPVERASEPGKEGHSHLAFWVSLTLVAVTFLVYRPILDADFIDLDDQAYVVDNPQVQAGLTPGTAWWALTTFKCGNWHPLTWLSLLLDCSLYGGNKPVGFHFTNLAIHLASVVLLFHLWRRWTGAVWRSAFVAALFAIHPLHVESVAWVAERKDVLCALFWILTLWAYALYVERPYWSRYALMVFVFVIGLTAKPMLVTLPFVLLLLDYWPLMRRDPPAQETQQGRNPVTWRRLVIEKAPLFVLVLASSILTLRAQQQAEALVALERFPFSSRVLNALRSYASYLLSTIWPADLTIMYQHPQSKVLMAHGLAAAIVLLLVTLGVILARRRRYLFVGWFWYLGTLMPVIGLVQVGSQALADRYTYIPLIGIFVAVAWGVPDAAEAIHLRGRKLGLACAAAVVLAACAFLSWSQVLTWHDRGTVWLHALEINKDNAVAHDRLGALYADAGMPDKAIEHFTKAVKLQPDSLACRYDLGVAYLRHGDSKQAYDQLVVASKLKPDWAELHQMLALACFSLPDPNLVEARDQIQLAIKYGAKGDASYALSAFIEHKLGHLEAAAALFEESVRLNPKWTDAANNRARQLLAGDHPDRGNAVSALLFAEQACLATKERRSDFLETLAAAQAALGRSADAVQTQRKAIAAAPDAANAKHLQALQQKLKQYENDQR